ncbi:DNA polymerase alpha catalytic subunit-like [Dendronephthya gigantea]|uniref:DNA polymerase alpha catalytic subunit-like n=1 Tax=Dendronephthya gigantea TaxID=151771 RepID=UPI00106D3B85|nr:DNA polymerase alpha catalytic subunit-like [Dendronephthya gigantea]
MAPTKDESVDDSSLDVESVATRRGRRSKKETGASAALKKIKQSRESGEKVKYEVDEIDNVYDEVDEAEYSKVVRKRQLQDDWIVDDDGGYVDDGREIFDEDLDEKPSAAAPKKGQKKKINVKKPAVKPKTIESMFLMGSKSKKPDQNKNVNIEEDEFLNGILQDMNSPKPEITTAANRSTRQGGRTPTSAGPRKAMPRRLQPPAASSYYKNAYREPVRRASKITTTPPFVSRATKQRNAAKSQPSNVFKHEPKDEDNSMETPCFNGDDGTADYIGDDITQNVEEEVKENVETDNGAEAMEDFADDDFNTEDMEALDAVEEKAIETEIKKEENSVSKNRGASDLAKPKIQFDNIQPGEAFETIRGQIHANPNEQFKEISVDSSSLNIVKNEQGENVFKFYWFDAYEDSYAQPGTIFMFGKVWIDKAKSYVSCCVVVKNIERTLFFLPRNKKLAPDGTETEETVGFTDVYQEFNDDIADRYKIMKFSARRTLKKYAFEVEGVPPESEYLEVKYSANFPKLPSNMVGKTFSRVFGTNTSSLEQLLLQRKLKGPGWLKVKMPQIPNQAMSWCKLEAIVSKPDHITPLTEGNLEPPPLVVLSVSLRTILNPRTHLHEVLAVTGLVHQSFRVDKVAPKDKYFQHYFCAVTKPQDSMFPYDFKNVLKKQEMNVEICPTERSLLGFFMASLLKLDPDVIVGHDISSFDLNILLHRISACKIPNWSRMGRLRRQVMPKLTVGSKGGFAERTATCGRLICDVKCSAQELIRSKSYDLTELCKVILKSDRTTIADEDTLEMFSTSNALVSMLNMTLTDSLHALRIMYELNVMPLALQITNIAGNLMARTLLGGRSERNEYLLLHAFDEKSYICPDKSFEKKQKTATSNEGDEANAQTTKKGRKKPAYSGGLVLEPKRGFYDKFILLLDFNSLYPSIIQEYNICYTTVNRSPPEGVNKEDVESWVELPDSDLEAGVLPVEIRKLVERRREVKKLMKGLKGDSDEYLQYDIRQKALKLTANSMYGCLGFSHSRFYAKPLAALVTSKGREILLKTKDLVQGMNLDVIYGDTDSIMINTNTTDFKDVLKLGNKVKNEVNKLYKLLEIDIDGVYKSMLLLKKKKYAAISVQALENGKFHEAKETKGLDIVRRDWCQLAKDAGNYVLDQILSAEVRDTIVENIADYLGKVGKDVQGGSLSLEKFVINKQLTKAPNEYPDKKSLPHVHVALWMKSKNKKVNVGDTIPYVICDDGSTLSMAQRAYHPEEFQRSETLILDSKYYLANQVHPVVSRLCDPIDGTDSAHIASCLGLDPSGYRSSIAHKDENDALLGGEAQMSDEERFKDCDPFSMRCKDGCGEQYVYDLSSTKKALDYSQCSHCNKRFKKEVVINKLTLLIRKHVKKYYAAWMICDDSSCGQLTRDISSANQRGALLCACERGHLFPEYNDTTLYTQLLYYQRLFEIENKDLPVGEKRQDYREWFSAIHSFVTNLIQNNSYSEVDLQKLFRTLCSTTKA